MIRRDNPEPAARLFSFRSFILADVAATAAAQ